jgi:hypothetical protein
MRTRESRTVPAATDDEATPDDGEVDQGENRARPRRTERDASSDDPGQANDDRSRGTRKEAPALSRRPTSFIARLERIGSRCSVERENREDEQSQVLSL